MPAPIHPFFRPAAIAPALSCLAAALAFLLALSAPAVAQTATGNLQRGAVIPGVGLPDLVIPPLDPENGRRLYGRKGCVVCHAVNGIGGDRAVPFDAYRQPLQMNPFDFTARMWTASEAMLIEQLDFGGIVDLTGSEIADLFAFINSVREQRRFSEDDVPRPVQQLYD